jgi:hypothetical protein
MSAIHVGQAVTQGVQYVSVPLAAGEPAQKIWVYSRWYHRALRMEIAWIFVVVHY